MTNFGDYLNKYGVTWVERYLSRPIYWTNRGSNKLTGVIAHTEGVPLASQIPGTADRTLYHWFSNVNNSYTNAYITFSGVFELYVPIEHGTTGTGSPDDNAQTFQIETQDNGRWDQASTYTQAQYKAWAGVYCALVEWSQTHPSDATPILFERSKRGLRGHNEIDHGRDCPGGLNVDRILQEASDLWNKTNNPKPQPDNLYKVSKAGKQLGAYKYKQNALNRFINDSADKVVYNNLDVTADFMATQNRLEEEIEGLKTTIESLNGNIESLTKDRDEAIKQRDVCEVKVNTLENKIKEMQETPSGVSIVTKLLDIIFRKNG